MYWSKGRRQEPGIFAIYNNIINSKQIVSEMKLKKSTVTSVKIFNKSPKDMSRGEHLGSVQQSSYDQVNDNGC